MIEDFGFLAPNRLGLLVLPIALVLGYLLLQARRRRYAVRFTSVELLDQVAPDRPGWRRHLTAVGLVIAVMAATVSFARPVVAGDTFESVQLVVLAIDTSISMKATDVAPSRVDAAREAAGAFLDAVPEGVAVGVVLFDGTARQGIAPTTRIDAVRRVIENSVTAIRLGNGTAIGDAVFLGIDSIQSGARSEEDVVGTIIVLSDGETTAGRSNDDAAAAARRAGIPVHTIAFGTSSGYIDEPGFGRVPVPVNEAALGRLAGQTDGRTFSAETLEELSVVYEDLGRSVQVERESVEIGDWFAGTAVALLSLVGLASLLWFGRLP